MQNKSNRSGRPSHRRSGHGNNHRPNTGWSTLSLKDAAAQAIVGSGVISTDEANGANCLGVAGSTAKGMVTFMHRETGKGVLSLKSISKAELGAFIRDAKAGRYDNFTGDAA